MNLLGARKRPRRGLGERMNGCNECERPIGIRRVPVERQSKHLLVAAEPSFPLALGKGWAHAACLLWDESTASLGRKPKGLDGALAEDRIAPDFERALKVLADQPLQSGGR